MMDVRVLLYVSALALSVSPASAQPATPPAEVVREIRVHGNHTTPDADVLLLSGLSIGEPASPELLAEAERRLRQSGRFSSVELRKRFRSISDPSDILVIVLVEERAGVSETDPTPGPLKRLRSAGMWLPIVDYEDGYGFTYGARVSFVGLVGRRSRVSAPLTWGGERKVALDVERRFERGPFTRVEGSLALSRRENPHYGIGDSRRHVRIRAERSLTSWLRAGGGIGRTNVSFGPLHASHTTTGLDLVADTRRDPAFPRNAVHAIAGIDHLGFDGATSVNRASLDVRGYVGLFGSTVLALRGTTTRVDAPLPPYEQQLIGGTALLRGYQSGYRAGDNLAAFSAELRMPVTSPLNIGRFGVKGFIDYGAVYSHGAKLSHQVFDRGIGGGVFLTATVLRLGLDVAWPKGESKKPRWHFGMGVAF